jgi:hypothetical protein
MPVLLNEHPQPPRVRVARALHSGATAVAAVLGFVALVALGPWLDASDAARDAERKAAAQATQAAQACAAR